jgi:hypothetical protein
LIYGFQIIGEQLLNELAHTLSMIGLRYIISLFFERRESVGDGH